MKTIITENYPNSGLMAYAALLARRLDTLNELRSAADIALLLQSYGIKGTRDDADAEPMSLHLERIASDPEWITFHEVTSLADATRQLRGEEIHVEKYIGDREFKLRGRRCHRLFAILTVPAGSPVHRFCEGFEAGLFVGLEEGR